MKKTILTLLATVALFSELSAGFGFFWHSEPCHPTVVVTRPAVPVQGYYVRHRPMRVCAPLYERVEIRTPCRDLVENRREPVRDCPAPIADRAFGY